jgi:hypothetical protein
VSRSSTCRRTPGIRSALFLVLDVVTVKNRAESYSSTEPRRFRLPAVVQAHPDDRIVLGEDEPDAVRLARGLRGRRADEEHESREDHCELCQASRVIEGLIASEGVRQSRWLSLREWIVGTDQIRLDVTGASLTFARDEGADRHQHDRLNIIRTVARYAPHLRLPYAGFSLK